jgi:hypothetical protein
MERVKKMKTDGDKSARLQKPEVYQCPMLGKRLRVVSATFFTTIAEALHKNSTQYRQL